MTRELEAILDYVGAARRPWTPTGVARHRARAAARDAAARRRAAARCCRPSWPSRTRPRRDGTRLRWCRACSTTRTRAERAGRSAPLAELRARARRAASCRATRARRAQSLARARRRSTRRCTPSCSRAREAALARGGASPTRAARAARRARRSTASRSRSRTTSSQAGEPATLRVAHPRGLRLALRRDGRSRGCAPPARSSSAARTWTSSRWARRPRTRATARRATRGIPRARRAARRAARRRRSPPASCRSRSAATPAARSASRPRSRGVVGMKPTYGRVSRYGLVAFASSLDQIGPFARTRRRLRAAPRRDRGPRPARRDLAARARRAPRAARSRATSRASRSACRASTSARPGATPGGARARARGGARELERAGAKLREVSLPHTRYAVATYYLIATAEASSNLARFDGVRYGRRAAGARRRSPTLYERDARRGLRRRGEAAHPARHLRALGRLLRRLLPEGAAGAHAAAPRLRRRPSRAAT